MAGSEAAGALNRQAYKSYDKLIYKMYEKIQVDAYKCTCEKCGHEWVSYRSELPTHCANRKCSNPTKWNVPGRSRKYIPKDTPMDSKFQDDESEVYL